MYHIVCYAIKKNTDRIPVRPGICEWLPRTLILRSFIPQSCHVYNRRVSPAHLDEHPYTRRRGSHSFLFGMLSFLKFVPLVLSTAALICLAVVFSACTSTSSPQDLWFTVSGAAAVKLERKSLIQEAITAGAGGGSSQQGQYWKESEVEEPTLQMQSIAVRLLPGHPEDRVPWNNILWSLGSVLLRLRTHESHRNLRTRQANRSRRNRRHYRHGRRPFLEGSE